MLKFMCNTTYLLNKNLVLVWTLISNQQKLRQNFRSSLFHEKKFQILFELVFVNVITESNQKTYIKPSL